ncbi:hypothetical protein J7413_05760 [Shimia sp. R10_1]|uniref:capsular polysaccharide export protein, LipB/KpsS family n=1 Tax=Shimia sp. R10_1 TaxID=2821095 RepID=UPI001ADB8A53|nr:hypothetical protein [Shimia sp. R10_1]MBO9473040.1 hypothetical protein [Shimia sp. R10_1]
MPKIILHLKSNDANPELNGWHLRLYREIVNLGHAEGIAVDIRVRDSDIRVGTRSVPDDRFNDGNLHIIDDRSVRAPGVLNAGVAYLWEFWHLDPHGTKAFSSIGEDTYAPSMISDQRTETFARNIKRRYLEKRKSKYDQPEIRADFAPKAVAVFFQGQYPLNSGATQHSDIEVLKATLRATGDQPIVVKPHPISSDAATIAKVKALAQHDSRITLTHANVHDILRASICTVSMNSTVALEGYLHGVPAILCGKADFHHLAHTVTDLNKMSHALKNALSSEEDLERYLTWYFLKKCIPINSGQLHKKIWEKFEIAGFPRERFG